MVPWLLCALLGGWGLYLLGRLYCLHRAMEALAGRLTDWLDRDTNTLLTLSLSRDPYVRRLTSQLNGQLRASAPAAAPVPEWRPGAQGGGDQPLSRSPDPSYCHLRLFGAAGRTEQSSVAARYLAQIRIRWKG